MNYHNVFVPVQHLNRPEVNPGGLCWIIFAKHENILQWPSIDPLTGITSSSFQLHPGKTWFRLGVTAKNRMYTETDRKSTAGPYSEMQVTGYLGGSNANLTLAAKVLRYHQYVVMFKDLSGEIRYLGNKDSGADCTTQYTSGDSDTSRKRSFTFSWEHSDSAQILTGQLMEIITDPITPPFEISGDFSDDFNQDFNI